MSFFFLSALISEHLTSSDSFPDDKVYPSKIADHLTFDDFECINIEVIRRKHCIYVWPIV